MLKYLFKCQLTQEELNTYSESVSFCGIELYDHTCLEYYRKPQNCIILEYLKQKINKITFILQDIL